MAVADASQPGEGGAMTVVQIRRDDGAAVKDWEAFVRLIDIIREAVNSACTCGGDGPGMCCPACEVWHSIKRQVAR